LRHSWGMREIQPCRAENNFPASCVNEIWNINDGQGDKVLR
jgi:hypothetical protein